MSELACANLANFRALKLITRQNLRCAKFENFGLCGIQTCDLMVDKIPSDENINLELCLFVYEICACCHIAD